VSVCLWPLGVGAQVPSTTGLLDRYARGDYTALTVPRSALDLQRMRQGLVHDAEPWIRDGRASETRRRQLVAATVALELARAGFDVDWGEGRQLIEWGSGLLRKGTADETERLWHLAALSLIHGAYDYELQVKQQKEAWRRFDTEPRFFLAVVLMLESETWPDPDRGEPWDANDAALEQAAESVAARRTTRQPIPSDVREKAMEYQRRAKMRSVIELLEDLSNEEAIRADALLRLGFLHLRLRHAEIAVEQFEDVLALTQDPVLLYLAHFLTGQAHEQDGDRANAIAAYRAALEALPSTPSASVAIASLLFLAGNRDEAASLIDAAVKKPAALDPWRDYQSGDFRFWSARFDALRKALQ
jgi:tetratricopeptide (TPR) repeat protein